MSLDLAVMVVIAVLIMITAALYWRGNRRAEAARHDAGTQGE